jgi:hypothetical protein
MCRHHVVLPEESACGWAAHHEAEQAQIRGAPSKRNLRVEGHVQSRPEQHPTHPDQADQEQQDEE